MGYFCCPNIKMENNIDISGSSVSWSTSLCNFMFPLEQPNHLFFYRVAAFSFDWLQYSTVKAEMQAITPVIYFFFPKKVWLKWKTQEISVFWPYCRCWTKHQFMKPHLQHKSSPLLSYIYTVFWKHSQLTKILPPCYFLTLTEVWVEVVIPLYTVYIHAQQGAAGVMQVFVVIVIYCSLLESIVPAILWTWSRPKQQTVCSNVSTWQAKKYIWGISF